LPKIGLNVDDNMVKEWKKVDEKSLDTAEYKEKSAVKNRRKKYKRQRAKKLYARRGYSIQVTDRNYMMVQQQQRKMERKEKGLKISTS
jgi:uncharacterized membrane protein YcgQ (UPF0703/DUF1980 family)